MLTIKQAAVHAQASTEVRKAIGEVFEYVARNFLLNYPRWAPQVREVQALSAGEFGEGSIAKQVADDQGRLSEATFKVEAFEPPSRFKLSGLDDPFRCSYHFEPASGVSATVLSFEFELLEVALVMRPFQKLIRAAVQEGAEQTVANIKRLLDGEEAGSAIPEESCTSTIAAGV